MDATLYKALKYHVLWILGGAGLGHTQLMSICKRTPVVKSYFCGTVGTHLATAVWPATLVELHFNKVENERRPVDIYSAAMQNL